MEKCLQAFVANEVHRKKLGNEFYLESATSLDSGYDLLSEGKLFHTSKKRFIHFCEKLCSVKTRDAVCSTASL